VKGSHYFSAQPEARSRPATATLRLPDIEVELLTDSGVFSHGAVDRGSELLLRSVAPPPSGEILDLGCGYGVIALVSALRAPQAHVWAIDVNQRALELTAANAARLGATNVTAAHPDDVPGDVRFDAILSNPPVRIGKDALHSLLSQWLARLLAGGAAHLVVQRHLGSDSLAAWLGEHGHSVERVRSRGGYRVLRVHVRP
jgi:16S rRNA (guanine1207-N2)-methyltransferase